MAAKRKKKLTKRKSSSLSAFKKAVKKNTTGLKAKPKKTKFDPLWTLEDGVTYSILSKFSNCRHRLYLGKVQGWKPKGFNFPLEFGNIFHLLSEAQDLGYGPDMFRSISRNYVDAKIDNGNFSSDEIRELSMLAGIAEVTFRHYVSFWEKNHSFTLAINGKEKRVYEKDFNWIGKEQPFDLSYKMVNGRTIRLRGKIDGMLDVRNIMDGNWLFETKTKGQIDTELITEGLHKDLQTGLYMTAMRLLQHGVAPKGVIYNVIRRTQLKPRVKDTPLDYVNRVEEDIVKRPEWYFMRWVREIDPYELDAFRLKQLDPQLHQIAVWWDSIKGNPSNPFETSCDDCFGSGKHVKDEFCKEDFPHCQICDGKGVVPNLEHYERGFSDYDSMYAGKGDFFTIITQGNFAPYERSQFKHPELENVDSLENYL